MACQATFPANDINSWIEATEPTKHNSQGLLDGIHYLRREDSGVVFILHLLLHRVTEKQEGIQIPESKYSGS